MRELKYILIEKFERNSTFAIINHPTVHMGTVKFQQCFYG